MSWRLALAAWALGMGAARAEPLDRSVRTHVVEAFAVPGAGDLPARERFFAPPLRHC